MTHPTETSRLQRLLGFLAADPANQRLRADIFDSALVEGDFEECHRQSAWVLSRDPLDAAWRHRLALLDMARGEWDEARQLLESLRDEGGGNAVNTFNLAYVDFAQARFERAQEQLLPLVVRAAAEVPQALALLVSCQHRGGDPAEAVATFERHAAQGATPAAYGAASLAAIDAAVVGSAQAWSDRALAGDPRQQEALVARATLLVGARDAAAALRTVALALQRSPDDGRVLSIGAMAEMLAGNLPRALELFARAVVAMPDHVGTWIGYGWCAVFLGDVALARRTFEAALALDPNFGESHGALAVAQALAGESAQAEESVRRAQGLDRRGLSAEYAQALLDGETHDSKRFLARAQRALSRHAGLDGRSLAELVLARR